MPKIHESESETLEFKRHWNNNTLDLPEGYRMTELGPLPEEWRVVRLGDLLKQRVLWVKNGFPQGGFNEEGKGVPHLRPFNINDSGEISLHQIKYVPPPPDDSPYWLRKGDILFNNTNSEDLVGKVAYFDREGTFVLSNHMTIVRVLDKRVLNNTWLAWWLLHLWYRGFTQSLARRHVNQASISLARLRGIPIPLPPLAEQRAIAHVLRTVQEAKAKEATERVIAAARELKKSLMRHLFTYGPVPVDQADAVEMQETELDPLPAHWRVVRLREVFDIQQGKALSRKKDKGIRPRSFLRTANVLWGKLDLSTLDEMDFTPEEEKKYALQYGDLLVCEGGDIGRTAIWEEQLSAVYYQNHLHRLRRKTDSIEPRFYMYWLQAALTLLELYRGTGNRTTIPNLSRTRLAAFPIPLPPLSEQREIARMLQAVDEKIRAEEARKQALEVLFRTLLDNLMTGRIRGSSRRLGAT